MSLFEYIKLPLSHILHRETVGSAIFSPSNQQTFITAFPKISITSLFMYLSNNDSNNKNAISLSSVLILSEFYHSFSIGSSSNPLSLALVIVYLLFYRTIDVYLPVPGNLIEFLVRHAKRIC